MADSLWQGEEEEKGVYTIEQELEIRKSEDRMDRCRKEAELTAL